LASADRIALRNSPRRFAARLGLLHARTRLPALLFAGVIAVSTLQRLALFLLFDERLAGVDAAGAVRALLVGLRFDVVVAGMVILPLFPVMFLAPPMLIRRRGFKWAIGGLCGLLLAAVAFLLVADGFYFQEFGERLNHQVFQYLGKGENEYILWIIWRQYPVLPVLAGVLALAGLSAWAFVRWGFNDAYNVGPLWQAIVWPTVFGLLVGLGIRGTISSHAINTGPAYFSNSLTLSQVTLNGLFTLRQALVADLQKQVDLDRLYPTLNPAEADRRARRMMRGPRDTPVADAVNPLHRLTAARRPRRDLNVVMVVLESMHWAYVGHLGGEADLTPNLDAIAARGVHATQAMSVGDRTQRGFAGIVAGFPDLPVASATTRNEVAGSFLTLPRLLKQRGYQTLFIYGGPAHRDHRQTFLASNGVDRFVVESDLPVRTFRTKLGYNDDDLFQSMIHVLNDLPDDRPFFALSLTLTFHRPYEFPGSHETGAETGLKREMAAVRFTDRALGRFMENARRQPWFEDTLFVFVADHGGGALEHPRGPGMNRVPLIFYGPGIDGLEPRAIDRIASQMDIPPTVMGLLGGDYRHCFFGRDLLDPKVDSGLAYFISNSSELWLYHGPGRATYVPPHGAEPLLQHFDPITGKRAGAAPADPEHVKDAVAVVQVAHRLFKRERFNTNRPANAQSGPANRPQEVPHHEPP